MADTIRREVHCETAEEFLDEILSISRKSQDNNFNAHWLFRGQGKDIGWSLTPSFFRKDEVTRKNIELLTKLELKEYFSAPEKLTEEQRESYFCNLLLAERDIFINFFNIVDMRGLPIPDDSRKLRSYLETISPLISASFTEDDIKLGLGLIAEEENCLSLLALAQHYGIPTRLLDWSRRSLVAAFFAAESGCKIFEEYPNERLVVWALFYPTLGTKITTRGENFSLRIITAPGATNPNLTAQQGVFTLVHPRHSREFGGYYRPLEKVLWEPEDGENFRKDIYGCVLHKFTLPVKESPELLCLLEGLDITPSFIYPGYNSIVDDLKNCNRMKR